MLNLKRLFFLLILVFSSTLTFAQGETVEMADALRESGKIYVVVAVLLIIFLGLIAFLINIDRKVSKLEKQVK